MNVIGNPYHCNTYENIEKGSSNGNTDANNDDNNMTICADNNQQ